MKFHFLFLASLVAGILPATPSLSNVTMTEDPATRRVTVSYDLAAGENAVVTFDVLTNGVSIGAANIGHYAGQVAKLVTPGTKTFTWLPEKDWPFQYVTDGSVQVEVKAWATNAPPDYMVVELGSVYRLRYYTCAAALPDGGLTNRLYRTQRMVMRKIPAAGKTFRMGTPTGESGATDGGDDTKAIPHLVTLTEDFYLGVFEFTRGQYHMGVYAGTACESESVWGNWSLADGMLPSEAPIATMKYDDVRGSGTEWASVTKSSTLYTMRARSAVRFDLPSEAQWEFACRAGTGTGVYRNTGSSLGQVVSWGSKELCARNTDLNLVAWNGGTVGNSDAKLHRPGTLEQNAFGLYDMLGSVNEYCRDNWQTSLGTASVVDPKTTSADVSDTTKVVLRGGDMSQPPYRCRAGFRTSATRTSPAYCTGFRVFAPAIAY